MVDALNNTKLSGLLRAAEAKFTHYSKMLAIYKPNDEGFYLISEMNAFIAQLLMIQSVCLNEHLSVEVVDMLTGEINGSFKNLCEEMTANTNLMRVYGCVTLE